MKVALLLHLYQPPQQNAHVVHEIAKSSYLPLLKLLKQKKDLKLTINVPLSLLEWFEKEKIETFMPDLKNLIASGRVEIVGCGAYHPILTKFEESEVERQVILNEGGLAYYLGKTAGFEGEPSLMIKGVKGFFPPEMSVSNKVTKVLNELSYEWVAVDEVAVDKSVAYDLNHIHKAEGTDIALAVRNRALSLSLAFKRDSDTKDFMDGLRYIKNCGHKFVFIALDGETFGHHNKEGIELLENLVGDVLLEKCSFATYSDVVEEFRSKKETKVVESSWGASDEDVANANLYPRWYIGGNFIHEQFMQFEKLLLNYTKEAFKNSPLNSPSITTFPESANNLPVWNFNLLSNNQELSSEVKDLIKLRVSLDKALNSDKYWWSCKNPYYDVNMIKRSLEIMMKVVDRIPKEQEGVIKEAKTLRDGILGAIKGSGQ